MPKRRTVRKLRLARRAKERRLIGTPRNVRWGASPVFTHKKRPSNRAAGKGLRYERTIAEALKAKYENVLHTPWIHFEDDSGPHTASPDVVIEFPSCVVIVEVKLTRKDGAKHKLLDFYRPLVQLLHPGKPVKCVQVFRGFPRNAPYFDPTFSLSDLESFPNDYAECLWF